MNPFFFLGLGLLALVTLWHAFRSFRASQVLRKTVLSLRAGLLVLLLFLAVESLHGLSSISLPLFVLLDTSASMSASRGYLEAETEQDSLSSIELPLEVGNFLKNRFPDHRVHVFDLFRNELDILRKASGGTSPLSAALLRFLEHSGVGPNQRLLLYSDGWDTGSPGMPVKAVNAFNNAGVKVDTLAPAPVVIPDLALEELRHPRVAFIDQKTEVKVRVRSTFTEAVTTQLSLMDGQSVLHQQIAEMPPGPSSLELELEWMPFKDGEVLLTMQLQPVEGELRLHNNRAYLQMGIRAKRLRVLHIAGRPSWDVFHLRRLLKEIPEVDMIAFFILRDPFEDFHGVPESELALIRFPVNELFMRQLFKFDTVIFHNFEIRRFLRNPQFQQSFQKFLAEGKRIIVIGGEQPAGTPDYQELFLSGTGKERFKLEFRHRTPWHFREHGLLPVNELQRQPSFEGNHAQYNDAPSEMLLRTPYRMGRVDWVLEPHGWRWKIEQSSGKPAPDQNPSETYAYGFRGVSHNHAAFWQTLLFQPVVEKRRIFRDFSPGRPYHEQEYIAGMLDVPTRAASVNVRLFEESRNRVRFEKNLDLDGGKAFLELPRLEPGAYRIEVSCGCGDMEDVDHSLQVVGDWQEFRQIGPHHAWLEWLAVHTGGRTMRLDENERP